jgi:hypothetical protein
MPFLLSTSTRGQGVSSAPPTSSDAPTGGDSAKPLPWKFLASPTALLENGWSDDEFKDFGNPEKWNCQSNPKCTPAQVRRLVQETLGLDLQGKNAKSTYVALHFVDYGSGPRAKPTDAWYLYHSKDSKWSFQKFAAQRIYGSPTVLFIFVHSHAQGLKSDTLLKLSADQLKGLKTGAPPSGTEKLCAEDTKSEFQLLTNGALALDYKVRYDVAVVKRTPANVADLLSILKILGISAQGKEVCDARATESVTFWGSGVIENVGLPSDVSIAGLAANKGDAIKDADRVAKQIGSVGAFNDEQLYWWDASIGIPVHKIKDLQYSESDSTVVASQVDKQSAYAMFNLMLHPVDLSDPKSNVWPRILVGFPLSSSPWDSLFAGAGIGIPWKPVRNFQFFAGATFNRNKQPQTLEAGAMATDAQLQNDLRIHITPKLTIGINVPVKSVLDKLLK